MGLIGMTEAAKRMGRTSPDSARLTLIRAGVKLERIGARTLAVRESDLEKVIAQIGARKPGRPLGAKSKAKKKPKKD